MKRKADIVIIGGGVNGLSTAYNLAKKKKFGKIIVIEKSYIGSGASGRNAGGIRAQYSSTPNILLANKSLKMAEKISGELNFNIMFRQSGYLYIAKDELELNWLKNDVKLQNSLGVKSRILSPEEILEEVPVIKIDGIIGGSFHQQAGIARHDGVVWGYAKEAKRLGVEIKQFTEVIDLDSKNDEIKAVITKKEKIETETVVNAAGAHSKELAKRVGIELPITPVKREILVTESLKPFLDPMVIDLKTDSYWNQTDRGELVAQHKHAITKDEESTVSTKSTFSMLKTISRNTVKIFPQTKNVNVLRQWAGTYDMTPDGSPILGEVSKVKGFIQANGFSGAGFKLSFAIGELLAELIETKRSPEILKPFNYERFEKGELILEREAGEIKHQNK